MAVLPVPFRHHASTDDVIHWMYITKTPQGSVGVTIPGSVLELTACDTQCCDLVDMLVFGERLDSHLECHFQLE